MGWAKATPKDAVMELLTMGAVKLQGSVAGVIVPGTTLKIAAPLIATALIKEYVADGSLKDAPLLADHLATNPR